MMKSKLKTVLLVAVVGSSFVQTLGHAQTVGHPAETAKPAQIDKNGLLILIRSTLYALDLANKSGNYSILREISAPGFAAANDAARLSQIFRNLREKNADLSGVLVYEPQLTVMPQIEKNGLMRLAGFFPSATSQLKFEMLFAPVDGRWKIFGLMADFAPAVAAPSIPVPPPANPDKAPQKKN